jgi:hypothetical protein
MHQLTSKRRPLKEQKQCVCSINAKVDKVSTLYIQYIYTQYFTTLHVYTVPVHMGKVLEVVAWELGYITWRRCQRLFFSDVCNLTDTLRHS